eukprot:537622_1
MSLELQGFNQPNVTASPQLVITVMTLNVALCVPFVTYIYYQLYKHWDNICFIKRRRINTFTMVIFGSFMMIVYIQLECCKELFFQSSYLLILFTHFFYFISQIGSALFFVARIWYLYYDHKLYEIVNNKVWHSVINNVHFENSWFVKQKHTYGDEKYILLNICVPIFVVSSIIYLILYFTLFATGDLVSGVVISIAAVFGVKIWRKFPKYHDTLSIRKELKIYLLLTFVSIIVMAIYILISWQFPQIYFVIHFCGMISISIALYILVIYPIKSIEMDSLIEMMSLQTHDVQDKKHWIEFLNENNKQMDHYSSFMTFLGQELSAENLLFITEYLQLKRHVINNTNLLNADAVSQINGQCDELILPTSNDFPISFIVTEYKDFMVAVKSLYSKYVERDRALYEINISHSSRHAITESIYVAKYDRNSDIASVDSVPTYCISSRSEDTDMYTTNVINIFKEFNTAANEIGKLLMGSFHRFKRKNTQ